MIPTIDNKWFRNIVVGLAIAAFAGVSKTEAAPASSCTNTAGVMVCRHTETASRDQEIETIPSMPEGSEPDLLVVFLDIPSSVIPRLADDPENNRKFHPRRNWDYRGSAPGRYESNRLAWSSHGADPRPPVWQYRRKDSFAYTPKRSWDYDRDVFSRLWRSNIIHDTRLLIIPIE